MYFFFHFANGDEYFHGFQFCTLCYMTAVERFFSVSLDIAHIRNAHTNTHYSQQWIWIIQHMCSYSKILLSLRPYDTINNSECNDIVETPRRIDLARLIATLAISDSFCCWRTWDDALSCMTAGRIACEYIHVFILASVQTICYDYIDTIHSIDGCWINRSPILFASLQFARRTMLTRTDWTDWIN